MTGIFHLAALVSHPADACAPWHPMVAVNAFFKARFAWPSMRLCGCRNSVKLRQWSHDLRSPQTRFLPFSANRGTGYSLVELLVVMGIIAILTGAVMVAGGPLMRASQLSQGAQMVADQLQLAHQYALSKNTNVEVRFYQYADTSLGEVPGTYSGTTGGRYRALQIFALHDNLPSVPLGTVQRLPSGVCMDSGLNLSSLFANTKSIPWVPATDPQPSIPNVGTQYQCAYVQFLGSGGTNLNPTSQNQWFLTVHYYRASGSSDNLTTPPNNFFTIQIDPINGHIRTFRP